MMATISQKAFRDLRQDLFNHLQTLPLSFFDSHTHGDLMSRLTNDIDAINRLIAQNITQLLASVLTVVIIVIATFTINVWMALGTLSVFPFLLVMTSSIARLTRRSFRDLQLQLGQMNGMLEETITGERVVQAFCREQVAITSFDVLNTKVRDTGTRAQFLSLLVPPLITGLMNLDIAVVAGLGGFLATKGLISVGMIATFITYSRRISNPFRQIGDLYNSIQAALAGAERVFNVMNEPAETGLTNGDAGAAVYPGRCAVRPRRLRLRARRARPLRCIIPCPARADDRAGGADGRGQDDDHQPAARASTISSRVRFASTARIFVTSHARPCAGN